MLSLDSHSKCLACSIHASYKPPRVPYSQRMVVFGDIEQNPFAAQLLHFREAVLAGRKPEQNTLELNYNTIAVLDAIAACLKSGQTEPVKTLS